MSALTCGSFFFTIWGCDGDGGGAGGGGGVGGEGVGEEPHFITALYQRK